MSKFIVTSFDDEGKELSMTLEYSNTGFHFLKSWNVVGDWPGMIWRWIWAHPPYTREVLFTWRENALIREVKEVPEDLTFAVFWDAYDYKVGDRKKAEKIWNATSDADKMAAMAALPRYKYWLLTNTTPMVHATTYLNQRRYENEFIIKKG
ncbi:hypothetical protein [Dyadobacter frigoris]|uniref:Uncharacterized protein n=1 Tax=Dyadobacter frigoris TaxID=2576211 RepID=A0A4U6CZX7_9BACT|nr:hypothetical protein [Dyadobacter frigoris]TKT89495.1 hypothetical protein FDK13_24440 [Dyadobacter frigoris]